MKGYPLRGGDEHERQQVVKLGDHASMKGRPLRGDDLVAGPPFRQQLVRASMKGRPLRGGWPGFDPVGAGNVASMKGRPLRGGDWRLSTSSIVKPKPR